MSTPLKWIVIRSATDGSALATNPTNAAVPPAICWMSPAASFETNARAQFNANCGTCHRGQNGQATNSLNLTGVDQPNGATPNQACNQALLRVSTVDLNQSSIYLTTQINGGAANHPYHFNNNPATETAFRNAVNVWINAEKTAP
jgi:hypothetical protein